jgi:5-formyltetrahydrofolate cyclo-ligase
MSESITEQKKQYRQECRQIRAGLGDTARAQASLDICAKIECWTAFQHCSSILTYMPMKSEVDLRPLLERHPQKRWLIPRIAPEEGHSMYFHPYDPQRLVRHPFGMEEPAADLPVICPDEVQLALVPGLAFDRRGWRLGYGGGYYDRFLKGFCGVVVGITFQALLLESLPHDLHDAPVQWLVSENGLFPVSSNESTSLHQEVTE